MPVTTVRDEGTLRMWVCRLPVHIDPAGFTVYTEIVGEFAAAQWADRVVGPYGEDSMHSYPCRGGRLCPPTERTAFYGNLRRIRTASQILNAKLIYRRYSNAAAYKFGVP